MRHVPVRVMPDVLPPPGEVVETLSAHRTLADVLAWCALQDPRRDLADVVVQDEFTHDVVLELGGGLFAVYDTT